MKDSRKGAPGTRYHDFADFLRDEGIEGEIRARVEKRVIAMQLEARRKECKLSKAELARRIGTSRTQIDRVLDPRSQNVTLETLHRVAAEMGKRLHLQLID
jgi:DNA-binding phage protein